MKMFNSYQKVWGDAYDEMDRVVLTHLGVNKDYTIDRDFPRIAPEDQLEQAQAIQAITAGFPQFVSSRDVQQAALLAIGVNNTGEVLDDLDTLFPKTAQETKELLSEIKEYGDRLEAQIDQLKVKEEYEVVKGVIDDGDMFSVSGTNIP